MEKSASKSAPITRYQNEWLLKKNPENIRRKVTLSISSASKE